MSEFSELRPSSWSVIGVNLAEGTMSDMTFTN